MMGTNNACAVVRFQSNNTMRAPLLLVLPCCIVLPWIDPALSSRSSYARQHLRYLRSTQLPDQQTTNDDPSSNSTGVVSGDDVTPQVHSGSDANQPSETNIQPDGIKLTPPPKPSDPGSSDPPSLAPTSFPSATPIEPPALVTSSVPGYPPSTVPPTVFPSDSETSFPNEPSAAPSTLYQEDAIGHKPNRPTVPPSSYVASPTPYASYLPTAPQPSDIPTTPHPNDLPTHQPTLDKEGVDDSLLLQLGFSMMWDFHHQANHPKSRNGTTENVVVEVLLDSLCTSAHTNTCTLNLQNSSSHRWMTKKKSSSKSRNNSTVIWTDYATVHQMVRSNDGVAWSEWRVSFIVSTMGDNYLQRARNDNLTLTEAIQTDALLYLTIDVQNLLDRNIRSEKLNWLLQERLDDKEVYLSPLGEESILFPTSTVTLEGHKPHDWLFIRIAGIALLTVTLLGYVLLLRLASRRRKRLKIEQVQLLPPDKGKDICHESIFTSNCGERIPSFDDGDVPQHHVASHNVTEQLAIGSCDPLKVDVEDQEAIAYG